MMSQLVKSQDSQRLNSMRMLPEKRQRWLMQFEKDRNDKHLAPTTKQHHVWGGNEITMNTELTTLKTELREFGELSKTLAPWKWKSNDNEVIELFRGHLQNHLFAAEDDNIATFIARSRNISPAMAECLLVAVEGLEKTSEKCTVLAGSFTPTLTAEANSAVKQLQQILNIWEAAK